MLERHSNSPPFIPMAILGLEPKTTSFLNNFLLFLQGFHSAWKTRKSGKVRYFILGYGMSGNFDQNAWKNINKLYEAKFTRFLASDA